MDLLDLIDAVQSVVDGVLFGATYALLGIGFTLVFGVMHKINLSYAAASIGAAYASLLVLAAFKAPPPSGLPAGGDRRRGDRRAGLPHRRSGSSRSPIRWRP